MASLRFHSGEALKAWLLQTAAGQTMLAELRSLGETTKQPVLLVLRAGEVRAYADRKRVDVRIVRRLHSDAESADVELDDLAYLHTPRTHRHLLERMRLDANGDFTWHRHSCVAIGDTRRVTVGQYAKREWELNVLAGLARLKLEASVPDEPDF